MTGKHLWIERNDGLGRLWVCVYCQWQEQVGNFPNGISPYFGGGCAHDPMRHEVERPQ